MRKTVNGQVVIVDGWSIREQNECKQLIKDSPDLTSLVDNVLTLDSKKSMKKYPHLWDKIDHAHFTDESTEIYKSIFAIYNKEAKFAKPKQLFDEMYYIVVAHTVDDYSKIMSLYYAPTDDEFWGIFDHDKLCQRWSHSRGEDGKRVFETWVDKFPKQWIHDNHPEYESFLEDVPEEKLPKMTATNIQNYNFALEYSNVEKD